jgi:hypothetical protein
MVRLTHFLGSLLADDGEVINLTRWQRFPPSPRNILVFISVRGWVNPKVIVGLERLRQFEKSSDLIGNLTRDLSACSTISQWTMLWRVAHPFPLVQNVFIAIISDERVCKILNVRNKTFLHSNFYSFIHPFINGSTALAAFPVSWSVT